MSGYDSESVTKGGVSTSNGSSWSWTRSGTVWDDGRNDWSESWSKYSWKDGEYAPGESEVTRGSFDPEGTQTQTNNLPEFGEAPRLNKAPKQQVPPDLQKPPKPSDDIWQLPTVIFKEPQFKEVFGSSGSDSASGGSGNDDVANNPSGGGNPYDDDPCYKLLQEIVALGKELKKRYDDLRLDDQDLYNRRREMTDPPVSRIPPLSGRRTTVTGDPGSWEGHKAKYIKDQERLQKLIQEFQDNDDCDDDNDPFNFSLEKEYIEAVEYSEKAPPEKPDIRNKSNLLARAIELGAEVIDGVLWVGAGVGGAVLIGLEIIARFLGLDLRLKP
ncbi:hypothetical protein QUA35_12155 [Microcoleus sp. N9_B2]|uniref:hypothetical protein n=1 Tax=unclassified Microcoleus TaxID=2642155 RepID=UPI002FD0F34F